VVGSVRNSIVNEVAEGKVPEQGRRAGKESRTYRKMRKEKIGRWVPSEGGGQCRNGWVL